MITLNIFLVLVIYQCALSDGSKLNLSTEPCDVSDIECISKATQVFLDNTYQGIPEYNIKKLDPITIPSLEKSIEKINLNVRYNNLKVTGFKNQKISHFTLVRDTKAVNFKTKVNFTAEGELVIELPKSSKTYTGEVTIEASAEGGAAYSYSVKTDDKGVEHYEAGPETISCEIFGEPTLSVSSTLEDALKLDSDFKKIFTEYGKQLTEGRKQTACRIVETVYAVSVHNIRAAARILPKSAYFKNV
ncbi:juvenile hormone-binding protein [Galleria mellonella]|uniref:Juvenile hormone-binding protein n=1 Tax=Galleria mellonella TaxID=7137 RepID=A0A6J1W7X0_GALME|nr:juvenile hormone-binding protein [Galleria mellonella]